MKILCLRSLVWKDSAERLLPPGLVKEFFPVVSGCEAALFQWDVGISGSCTWPRNSYPMSPQLTDHSSLPNMWDTEDVSAWDAVWTADDVEDKLIAIEV